MTKLSETALTKCQIIIQAIKGHPFNKELENGSLNIEKFSHYIKQDTLYLRDFGRSLVIIASKAPLKFVKDFLSFVENLFARLKHFRSVATRFEKLSPNYKSMVYIACLIISMNLK